MKSPPIPGSVCASAPTSHPASSCHSRIDGLPRRLLAFIASLWICSAPAQDSHFLSPTLSLEAAPASPAVPEAPAFLSTNWNVGFTLGASFGVAAMGSTEAHHLTTATLHVGKLLESERPFLRHVELAGELWSGAQYHPDTAYLVGLTPVLRYHLLPGSRFDPFLDGGAGVTATDIGRPDLSTTFEFNLQAGAGFHWVLRKNMAFTFAARYIHLSNAHIASPNYGVNSFLFSSGLTWFF
jgi:lipid A 3-O-deacylase